MAEDSAARRTIATCCARAVGPRAGPTRAGAAEDTCVARQGRGADKHILDGGPRRLANPRRRPVRSLQSSAARVLVGHRGRRRAEIL